MAKKKFDPPIQEQLQTFAKGVDQAFAQYLLDTQSKLSAASPVKTGRLASSWRVAKGFPDTSVEPPRDDEQVGSTTPAKVPNPQQIRFDGTWYISNSLPYAERAGEGAGGQGPYNGRRGATNWYKSISVHSQEDWQRALRRFLRKPPPRNFRPT